MTGGHCKQLTINDNKCLLLISRNNINPFCLVLFTNILATVCERIKDAALLCCYLMRQFGIMLKFNMSIHMGSKLFMQKPDFHLGKRGFVKEGKVTFLLQLLR